MADSHWRNTMRPARFFILDARAAFPFVICLLHFRIYTLLIAALVTLVFWIVEQRGYTFEAALRWFRSFLVAPRRPATPSTALRYALDYGGDRPDSPKAKNKASDKKPVKIAKKRKQR